MIIRALELVNIRSYKNVNIEFNSGITLLSGDIGSGKSSVLQAIEFALLGFKRGDLEGIQILRKGSREGSVKLTLKDTKINSEIVIFRKLKKAKNSETISQENGYIKFDDELVEMSPNEINSYIFERLSFPKEFITKDKNLFYRFTIYTAQEQLKEILFAEPEKRLELLRKLFRIDKYKQLKQAIFFYLQNLKTVKKEYEVRLERKGDLKKEFDEVNKHIIEIKNLLQIQNEKNKKLVSKILILENELKKLIDLRKNLEEKILKFEKALSSLNSYENMKITLEKEINLDLIKLNEIKSIDVEKLREKIVNKKENSIKKLQVFSKKIVYLKNQLEIFSKKKKDLEFYSKELLSLKSKKDFYKEMKKSFDYVLTKCQIKDCEVEMRKIQTKIKSFEKKKILFEENKKTKTQLELKIKLNEDKLLEIKSKLKNFDSLEKCPHCLMEVTEVNRAKIRLHLENERNLINSNLKEDKANFKKIEIELIENDKIIAEYDIFSNKILELTQKKNFLLEQEKKEEIKNRELNLLKKEIGNLEKNEFEKKIKEIEIFLLDEKKINLELENFILEEKKIQEVILNCSLEFEKIKNKENQILNLKKEIELKNRKIKKIDSQLEKKEKIITQLNLYINEKKEINSKEEKSLEEKELLQKEEREASNIIASSISKKEENLKISKKYEEQLLKLDKLKIEFEKLIKIEEFLSKKAFNIVDLLERKLFTSFYLEFNESFEYYFKQLIEDNEIEIRLDEEFSPLVEQNGYDVSINTLSGGEKSSLAVAYKLGLKKIIEENINNESGLNLLILDEPTDGFSTEQIDRLGLLLKESDVEQTLLVSHDEKLESIAQNVLKVEKKHHVSQVN